MKFILVLLTNGSACTLRVQDDAEFTEVAKTFSPYSASFTSQPGEALCIGLDGKEVKYPSLAQLPDAMQEEDWDGLERIFVLDGDTGVYMEWAGGIFDPVWEATKDYPLPTPGA